MTDDWGTTAYLFTLSALMGHGGFWLIVKGVYQPGVIVAMFSAVFLIVTVAGLPDDDEAQEHEGRSGG